MRNLGYKVQSMLVDERMEGDSRSRSAEALRVSLRLGESAIVLGEVRGDEARVLYESMRTGKAGSAILGTIHGDSARSVFERVVHDMGISAEAFMATDILVTVGSFRDRRTDAQTRRVSEIVATTDRPGVFRELSSEAPDFTAPVMKRAMSSCSMTEEEAMNDIRARSMLHAYLAEMGRRYGERYFSPTWIVSANSLADRMSGKDAEDILESFKSRFREGEGA